MYSNQHAHEAEPCRGGDCTHCHACSGRTRHHFCAGCRRQAERLGISVESLATQPTNHRESAAIVRGLVLRASNYTPEEVNESELPVSPIFDVLGLVADRECDRPKQERTA